MDNVSGTADVDSTLGEASKILTTLDVEATYEAATPFLSKDIKQHLEDLANQSNAVIPGETAQQAELRKQQLFTDYKNTLYDGIAANINDIMAPIVK
ncbi:MAG: hypothetical protein IJ880_14305 [Bacilli bacterium]|nr:hypothetical protein [Bacilli bacterium]